MTMQYYSPTIRREITESAINCQQCMNDQWVTFWSTDTMSNDYAYSDSNFICSNRLMQGEGSGYA